MDKKTTLPDELATNEIIKDRWKSLLCFEAMNILVMCPEETEEESNG